MNANEKINIDAPSYYVLPDGTELREVIRRFRGDNNAAEHLVQAVIEYAVRAGRKPGVTMAEDMRKALRCAQQCVNILEGRHVSDDGTPESFAREGREDKIQLEAPKPEAPKPSPSITLPIVRKGEVGPPGTYIRPDCLYIYASDGVTPSGADAAGPIPPASEWPPRRDGPTAPEKISRIISRNSVDTDQGRAYIEGVGRRERNLEPGDER